MPAVQSQIHNLRTVQQEILDVIHRVCVERGLRYSLGYGTLLGAVRHGGFIPWDDDIDLIMPREDYEKLLQIWDEAAPKGYLLQNKQTDPDFTQNFTKIRKDHTSYLHDEQEREKRYHKGIFVDIFPGDRASATRFGRRVQFTFSAVNLLYARGYTSGTGGAVGLLERCLLAAPKKWHPKLELLADKVVQMWNGRDWLGYVYCGTIGEARVGFPADMFENMTKISFQGKEYCCVREPEKILTLAYGDYLRLPPEEERVWKHHPILVDFEHNLEELQ